MPDSVSIVVERNIPFIEGLLEPYATVRYLAPEEFTPAAVKDADALLVRTRTRCDAGLLAGSKCSFVGTATIGTDHIDIPWCTAHGIKVANAPGCNAPAVAQYVFASLLALANRPISQYTIGIVGVGNVGSIVERWARSLNMDVLVNDPPRQRAEGGDGWSTLQRIASEADIITFHTPLDHTTHHLVDKGFVASLRRAPILVNAARGPVFDTAAVIEGLQQGRIHHAVIDCWEGEPEISQRLLSMADIATPHIAGYSREGKVRATRMVLDSLSRHFSLPHIEMDVPAPPRGAERVSVNAVAASYNPLSDTAALRSAPADFEKLRNTYALRTEVPSSFGG